MKKFYTLLFTALTATGFAQVTLPFSDSFSYPAGNLHQTAPWSVVGTAHASDHILLDGSKVTFAEGGTDAQVMFTTQNSGTVYYKIKFKVVSMAGVTDPNGGYLVGFAQNNTTFGGTLWTKRIDDNTFNLGIETRTATATNTTYSSTVYNAGTVYTIVVAYTFGSEASDDTTKLWVNPTANDEATPLLTDTHTGSDLTSIVSFFLRQDSVTETPSVEIDDLTIGLSFSNMLSNEKFNAIDGLKVYPNPVTNGTFYINTTADQTKDVVVYDVLGKEVVKTKTTNAVNVSNLKSGVYIVKITEEGKTATRKLVIK